MSDDTPALPDEEEEEDEDADEPGYNTQEETDDKMP